MYLFIMSYSQILLLIIMGYIRKIKIKSKGFCSRNLISLAGTGIALILLSTVGITNDLVHLSVFTAVSAIYIIMRLDNRILIVYGILLLIVSAINLHHPSAPNYAVLAFWLFSSGVICMLASHLKKEVSQ
jgi:hypothetical protein